MAHLLYTVYGDSAFDKKISTDMELVSKSILSVIPCDDIAAIILGGGYGRGEGGVVIKGNSMSLYNDYDMFLVTNDISKNKKKEYAEKVFEISEKLGEQIGVDVDFGPLKNISELRKMPFTLMYYELKEGHKVIYGDKNILDNLPLYSIGNLPTTEALNLMLNRGVGLMLAGERLKNKKPSQEDNEFIERNIFKAIMAAGDIFLMSEKNYSYSYVDRLNSIESFKDDPILLEDGFIDYYKMSINYKLQPENNFELLKERYLYTLKTFKKFYLFIFNYYWKSDFDNFTGYYKLLKTNGAAEYSCLNLLKNIYLNISEIGFSNFSIKYFVKYPRLRLFMLLPYFLFDDETVIENDRNKILGVSKTTPEKILFQRFIKIWNRFN
jgi:hypothetical protein